MAKYLVVLFFLLSALVTELERRLRFPSLSSPVNIDNGPDRPVELGIKFQSSVAGTITGIRFYKSAANGGTHVGNLWSINGTLLATATFTDETAGGWQQVSFASPVGVTANSVYVASYHTMTGHYSADINYFSSPIGNALLTGTNSVYVYGTGGFPSLNYLSTNYWVDVLFSPQGVPLPSPSPSKSTLSWAGATNAVSYNVYRSTVSGGPYSQIATGLTSLSYTDTNLSAGLNYYYVITSINSSGVESKYSHRSPRNEKNSLVIYYPSVF